MTYYRPNVRTLKVLMTHQPTYHDNLLHDRKNVRIFPDGKVFNRKMPDVNTVR